MWWMALAQNPGSASGSRLIRDWSPGIEELTWRGGVVVVSYLSTAIFCLRACRALCPPVPDGWRGYVQAIRLSLWSFKRRQALEDPRFLIFRAALVWFLASVSLFFLAVNRLFNLEDWVTISLRNLAVTQHWYVDRRSWQMVFLEGLVLVMAVVAFLVSKAGHDQDDRPKLLVAGWGALILLGLAAIRACSFHYTDRLLNLRVEGIRLGGAMELALIGLVALVAVTSLRSHASWIPRPFG